MSIFTKFFLNNEDEVCTKKLLTISLLTLFILTTISLTVGVTEVTFFDLKNLIFNSSDDIATRNIIIYARLPRALGAILVGSALAFSGLLLQITLNNTLASPSTIGVNAGAGFFLVAYIFFFGGGYLANSVVAFIGSFVTAMFVYTLANKSGASRMTIILAGVAIGSLLNSWVSVFTIINPDILIDKNTFYIGGLSYITMEKIYFAIPNILIGFTGALIIASKIDIIALGDEIAYSLGVNVKRTRFLTIIFASCAASGAVSIAGLLGFVGLIVPHITIRLIKNDLKVLIPFTAIFGSILVLLCDTLSRIIFLPYEVPVGIMLSCVGSPFFVFLLLKSGKRGRLR